MRRLAALSAVGALVVAGGAMAVLTLTPASAAASGCTVAYTVSNQWPGGFQGDLKITNTGNALTSWTVGFAFPDANQKVSQGWNATFTQSGSAVTVASMGWNGALATNASVNPAGQGLADPDELLVPGQFRPDHRLLVRGQPGTHRVHAERRRLQRRGHPDHGWPEPESQRQRIGQRQCQRQCQRVGQRQFQRQPAAGHRQGPGAEGLRQQARHILGCHLPAARREPLRR